MLSFDRPFLAFLSFLPSLLPFFFLFLSLCLLLLLSIYLELINYKCLSIIYYRSTHHESAHHLSTMNLFIIYLSFIYQYVCLTAYHPACLSSFCLFLSIVTSSLIWELWRMPPSEPDIIGNLISDPYSLKLAEITFCCLRQLIYGINSTGSIYSTSNWLKSLWSSLDLCIFSKRFPNNIHREVLYVLHFELQVSGFIFIAWIRKHPYICIHLHFSV